jgi:integrase/recombinase XerD
VIWDDGTPIQLSPREFDSVTSPVVSRVEGLKLVRGRIKAIEEHALSILKGKKEIDLPTFEREYLGAPLTGVIPFFTKYITDLTEMDRIGTAKVYRTARNNFKKYAGDFSFHAVTETWLNKYVAFMRGKSASVTSIAMHLRCLRTIFNNAIKEKYVSADAYPFGHRRFSIQEERKPKQALNEKQKNQVLTFQTDDEEMRRGVDFWILSYFCNGINPADIARLQFKGIEGGVMKVDRTKTMNTAKVRKPVEIPIRKEVAKIIAKYQNKSLDPNEYVFPVLQKGLTRTQEKARIGDWIATLNDGLRRAGVKLKFGFKFTTMTARHTFANILLTKGANKSFIQEALSHASMATTENYIAGFDFETKKKMSAKL